MGNIIFIVILILLLLLSVLFIFKDQIKMFKFGFFKNAPIKKRLQKIANDYDYLYMSNVVVRVNNSKDTIIDNILVTNKYVYVIKNVFWRGILNGKEIDEKWFLKDERGLTHVDNPLNLNYLRIKILASNVDIPLESFKNVIFYGDSLDVYQLDLVNNGSLFINYKDFEKTLLNLEKNKDDRFSDEEAEKIIQSIYKISNASLSHRKGK